jgi:hypothetical protein
MFELGIETVKAPSTGSKSGCDAYFWFICGCKLLHHVKSLRMYGQRCLAHGGGFWR